MMKNRVVISTPFDYFVGMRSAKCYTAWQSDFDMENITLISASIQKLTLCDLASKRDHRTFPTLQSNCYVIMFTISKVKLKFHATTTKYVHRVGIITHSSMSARH